MLFLVWVCIVYTYAVSYLIPLTVMCPVMLTTKQNIYVFTIDKMFLLSIHIHPIHLNSKYARSASFDFIVLLCITYTKHKHIHTLCTEAYGTIHFNVSISKLWICDKISSNNIVNILLLILMRKCVCVCVYKP